MIFYGRYLCSHAHLDYAAARASARGTIGYIVILYVINTVISVLNHDADARDNQ